MKHIIHARSLKPGLGVDSELTALLKRAVRATLDAERVEMQCEVNILYTDDNAIKKLNHAQRGIDEATDVLSFPYVDAIPGEPLSVHETDLDPATGAVMLGEIVLSVERARAQAAEYGHSVEREGAYLTVHSVLHLLGYDHEADEQCRAVMREREEYVMSLLNLER